MNAVRGQALLIAAVLCVSAVAEAASPVVNNLLPRGGQRGTLVEVRFVGNNLDDAVDLVFHQPGIELERAITRKPKEFSCRIAIAPDCPLGRHAIRVRTASGISNPFIFSVGALPESTEAEPNGSAAEAQSIELNTTINGVVESEDVDFFAVELDAGSRLAVEIEGIRLGHTLFDPKLRLFAPGGHELIAEDDTPVMRQDAAFVTVVEEPGRYCIAVSEATYGGSNSCEYRLHVGTFPRPLGISPVGGAVGVPVTVRWLGDPAGGASEVVPVSFSSGEAHVVVESESEYAPTPLPFHASDLATTMETEPNDSPGEAMTGAVPGAFEGVIGEAGDVDWFGFDGTQGQALSVEAIARSAGSPLDPVIELIGPDGSQVLYSDDGETLDSAGRVALPADGRYALSVRDHLGHGGPTFAYRVEIAPVAPSLWFKPMNSPACSVAVPRGNRTLLLLSVHRREFDGPVELEFAGLPDGVTADMVPAAAGATEVPVVFSADGAATPAGAQVEVRGSGREGDETLTGGLSHRILLVLGRNQTVFDSLHADRIAMAVTDEAPFSLELVPPKSPLPRNSRCMVTVRANRADGFDAPIKIHAPWKPKGIGLPATTIEAGQSEVDVPLEIYGGARIGSAPLVLVGESGGYSVSTLLTPILVEDAWVTMEIQETQGEQGSPVSWPAKLNLTRDFGEELLIEPIALPKNVSAAPLRVADATADVEFALDVGPDAPTGKQGPVRFQTAVRVNDETITISLGGAHLKIYKPLPKQLVQPSPKPDDQAEDKPVRRTRFPTE